MNEHRLDIMVHIIDCLLEDPQALEDVEGLVDALVLRGVVPGEARRAIGWLLAALEGMGQGEGSESGPGSASSVQLFARNDEAVLSLEAQGFLIELKELGLLDALQVEEVVEQALYRGVGPLGRNELKPIVAAVMLRRVSTGRRGFPHWGLWEAEEGGVH